MAKRPRYFEFPANRPCPSASAYAKPRDVAPKGSWANVTPEAQELFRVLRDHMLAADFAYAESRRRRRRRSKKQRDDDADEEDASSSSSSDMNAQLDPVSATIYDWFKKTALDLHPTHDPILAAAVEAHAKLAGMVYNLLVNFQVSEDVIAKAIRYGVPGAADKK